MDTFDLDPNHFDPRNQHQGDERLPVKFYMGAVPDDVATANAGHPMWRDEECIQIFQSKDNVIDRPVRDTDKQRWPRAYAAWKNTGESEPGNVGTRLEHWAQMTRAQVEEYRYFKIFTVEQLAELPDATTQKIMGAVAMKQKAILFVETAKGEAPFLKLKAAIDQRDGEIAFLKSQLAELSALVDSKLKAAA